MAIITRKPVQCAVIIILGVLAYLNTLDVPFILDDFTSFVEIPLVKKFSYFFDLRSAQGYSAYGGFVSRWFGYLTFALNYRVHGLNVAGYHVVNIAIHLCTALLVYRLVMLTFRTSSAPAGVDRELTENRARFTAFLAALLFVAHPLQTQAVTYIVQRFASLATMLYLLSVTCYIRGRLCASEGEQRPAVAGAWFGGAVVAAILALLTKQTAVTLPIAIVLYEVIFFDSWLKRRPKRAIALALGFSVTTGVVVAAVMLSSVRSPGEILSRLGSMTRLQTDMSRWDYLATQCRVLVTYLRLTVFPVRQQVDYDYPVSHGFLHLDVLASGLLLCVLLGGAIICFRLAGRSVCSGGRLLQFRLAGFGILWFFVTNSVESGFIPIVDVIFEHRMYLPSAGLFAAVASAVSLAGGDGARIPGWPRDPVLAIAAGVVLVLAGVTFARNQVWRSEVGLWEDNALKSPGKGRIYLNLGSAEERRGNLEGAVKAYLVASSRMPGQSFSALNLGRIYLQVGRFDDALAQFRLALEIDPTMGEVHNNIGKILELKGDDDGALREYREALKLKPYLAAPHSNIGFIYARQKRYADALREYEEAIARDPDYDTAYYNRGMALLATGRTAEAAGDFRRALELNPSNADAAAQLRALQTFR